MPRRPNPGPNYLLVNISIWKVYKSPYKIFCFKYQKCVFLKCGKISYGKLPPKQTEIQSWDTLCIDLISEYRMSPNKGGKKYNMNDKKRKDIYLQASTLIDPATGWTLHPLKGNITGTHSVHNITPFKKQGWLVLLGSMSYVCISHRLMK